MAEIETAVNGFGRIGTCYTRIVADQYNDTSTRAINAGGKPAALVAGNLKWDSVHGRFYGHEVEHGEDWLVVDGQVIDLLDTREFPDWTDYDSGLTVIEATGVRLNRETALGHIASGAARVVITSPAKKDPSIPTIVRGVNDTEETYNQVEDLVAVSSCSTNCIAPVLRVMKEGLLPIERMDAFVVHAITNSQVALDSPGKDLASSRAWTNVIPHKTGSATEVERFFPDVKFKAKSIRVPVQDGSLAILTAIIKGTVKEDEVVGVFDEAANNDPTLKGILTTNRTPMVSGEVIGDPHSAVVDLTQLSVERMGRKTRVEAYAWFDNEFGYANRVVEVAREVGRLAA